MDKTNLPTDDLKKFGILDADNSFTKKLSENEVQNFLQGDTIVADNDKRRITFTLTDNNSKLQVNTFERDKSLEHLIDESKKSSQYSEIKNLSKSDNELNLEKKAFIFNESDKSVKELDMIKDSSEVTKMILEKNSDKETSIYVSELNKLRSFLQDKIDKFPEIAKDITNDLNIVSNEINNVNFEVSNKQSQKTEQSDINLNVNDPDMYEDANRNREENIEEDEEREQRRGFKR